MKAIWSFLMRRGSVAMAGILLAGSAGAVTFKMSDQGDALSMDPHSLNESLQLLSLIHI